MTAVITSVFMLQWLRKLNLVTWVVMVKDFVKCTLLRVSKEHPEKSLRAGKTNASSSTRATCLRWYLFRCYGITESTYAGRAERIPSMGVLTRTSEVDECVVSKSFWSVGMDILLVPLSLPNSKARFWTEVMNHQTIYALTYPGLQVSRKKISQGSGMHCCCALIGQPDMFYDSTRYSAAETERCKLLKIRQRNSEAMGRTVNGNSILDEPQQRSI